MHDISEPPHEVSGGTAPLSQCCWQACRWPPARPARPARLATIEAAQGSEQNIASLTAVIARSPQDPEAYNVRGSAYGRAGQYREALQDFDRAIALNPNFYQAYSNRALIYRFLGDQAQGAGRLQPRHPDQRQL